MGRPPVPTHLKRNQRLVVMLTETEMEAYSAAARSAGAASLSDWIRQLLDDAAKTEREKGG